jgi:hypothetical protein
MGKSDPEEGFPHRGGARAAAEKVYSVQPKQTLDARLGRLSDLHRETKRLERVIQREFERIDEEERR